MEFGIFIQNFVPEFRRKDNPNHEHEVIMHDIELVKAADRAGFKYVWVTEHHFLDEYSHLSANDVICGYLADATERIHIGSGIFNPLPQVNHPAKVAERVAMLDHISNRRFEFGTGRGAGSHEILGFLAKDGVTDTTTTKEIWEETIPEFAKMWLQDEYEGHDGKWWTLPPRKILPKPYGKGHPAMWYAAGNTSSYEMAARKGLGVLGFSVGQISELEPVLKAYKNAIGDAEPVGAFVNDNIMVTSAAFVNEDSDTAFQNALGSTMTYLQSNVFRYHDTFPHPPEVPTWPDLIPDNSPEGLRWQIDGGLICGDPDEAVEQCRAWEAAGADQLSFGVGSATFEQDLETIRLIGEHVIPKIDTDPVHRTTRMPRLPLRAAVEYNLADLFEHAVDHFPDREYLVAEGKRRTYAEMEARANQLAHHLQAHGIGPGDHVGIYGHNSVEWVETLWAVFKLRATWININYRYVEEELAYLFENADLKALVYQREFAPRVRGVLDHLPLLQHTILIDDGSDADIEGLSSIDFEAAMAEGSPERDFGPRSADDRYILYTGGTTGMPKGVVWRHEDVFFALGGGIDPVANERVQSPGALVQQALAGGPSTMMPIAPLMHGATQWGVMAGSFRGNRVVLMAKFDAARAFQLIQDEQINSVMITGDAMAVPMIDELERAGDQYDLSSLFLIGSTAALFSPGVKDQFMELLPNVVFSDAIGSSEGGSNGYSIVEKGNTAMKGGPTVRPVLDSVVLDENLIPVEPGSGVVGKVARKGNIPLEYYKDPEKTAQTFVTGPDGTRYSVPGDFASYEADGTITLLGRGSVSINSGGEKIFPEEVEGAVRRHPEVYDCVVVGVPDERWGARVAAVIAPRPGTTPTLESIQEQCRAHIAGYKLPREIHLVDSIQRSPSGKPDYPWAKQVATGEISAASAT